MIPVLVRKTVQLIVAVSMAVMLIGLVFAACAVGGLIYFLLYANGV